MGAVITVMNMKGGVGKTTVTMNVGGLLGRMQVNGTRRRVLLIDYDPQFNLTQAFIKPQPYFHLEQQRKTTLAVLQDDETRLDPYKLQVPGNQAPPSVQDIAYPFYRPKSNESCVDIIPATMDLMYIALGHSMVRITPIEERFKKFVAEARTLYDAIFIDCHPAGSVFTKTALENSDHVVIPVAPERFAVRGIGLMLNFIKAARLQNSSPTPHILFNLTGRGAVSTEETKIRTNARFTKYCLSRTLGKFKAFSDPVGGEGFVWTSRRPWSTQAFRGLVAVAQEIIEKTGL